MTVFGTGAAQLLRFVSNLILWRLLFPEAFGVMAIINSLLLALAMFSDVGVGTTVVQSPRGQDLPYLRTAFTIQATRGVFIAAITFASAELLADFYDQPGLADFIRVAALTALVQGLTSTHILLAMRQVNTTGLVKVNLGSQLIGTAATIVWSLLAPSIWSLVGGGVIGAAARVLLSHSVLPGPRDRLGWDAGAARTMFTFGRWVFLSTLLTFAATQSDRLLFGKLITLAELGAYSIAQALAVVPEQVLAPLSQNVVFPLLSRARNQGEDLERRFRDTRVPILLLAAWMVTGLVAAGPALVSFLYGERAALAQWVLPVLAVGGWALAIRQNYNAALLALGRPQWVAASNGSKVAGMIVLMPTGFALFGFPGAVAGFASSELVALATSALSARRAGVGVFKQDALFSLVVLLLCCAGLALRGAARAAGWPAFVEALAIGSLVTVVFATLHLGHRRGRLTFLATKEGGRLADTAP